MSDDIAEQPKRTDVGHGRPPKEHQFKKGVCPNPAGRRGKGKSRSAKVADVLSEPVAVRQGGVERKMDAFEVSVRGLVKNALSKKNVGAALEFIRLCEHYDILKPEQSQRQGGVLRIPRSWDQKEWMEMFQRYGAPPWPGERSGLPDDEPLLRKEANDNTPNGIDSETREAGRRQRGSSSDRLDRKRIVDAVAHEERAASIGGKRQNRLTVELVLITLRERAAEGNVRASRAVHNLLEKYGSLGPRYGPFLVLPEALPLEEWEELTAKEQAKYRAKSGA